MIRQEDASEGLVEHQPDYGATVDHGTSYVLHCLGEMWLQAIANDDRQELLPDTQASHGWQ